MIDPLIPGVITAFTGGLGLIVKLVLDALKSQREGFEKFMGNHMSTNVRVLENLTEATNSVAVNLAALNEKTDRNTDVLGLKLDHNAAVSAQAARDISAANKATADKVAKALLTSDKKTAEELRRADNEDTRKTQEQGMEQ